MERRLSARSIKTSSVYDAEEGEEAEETEFHESTAEETRCETVEVFGTGRFNQLYVAFTFAFWFFCGAQTISMVFLTSESTRYAVCDKVSSCANPIPLSETNCTVNYFYPVPGASVVSDWELSKCHNSDPSIGLIRRLLRTPSLANSAFFLGFLFGVSGFGALADHIGRRPVIFIAFSVLQMGSTLCPFSFNFFSFCVCRNITGAGVGGVGLASFVLLSEISKSSYRAIAAALTSFAFCVGACYVSAVATFVYSWRHLQLYVALPGYLLYFILMTKVNIESPRYESAGGETDKAVDIWLKIAKINGKEVPRHIAEQVVRDDSPSYDVSPISTRSADSKASIGTTDAIKIVDIGNFHSQESSDSEDLSEATVDAVYVVESRSDINVTRNSHKDSLLMAVSLWPLKQWFMAGFLLWFSASFCYYGLVLDNGNLTKTKVGGTGGLIESSTTDVHRQLIDTDYSLSLPASGVHNANVDFLLVGDGLINAIDNEGDDKVNNNDDQYNSLRRHIEPLKQIKGRQLVTGEEKESKLDNTSTSELQGSHNSKGHDNKLIGNNGSPLKAEEIKKQPEEKNLTETQRGYGASSVGATPREGDKVKMPSPSSSLTSKESSHMVDKVGANLKPTSDASDKRDYKSFEGVNGHTTNLLMTQPKGVLVDGQTQPSDLLGAAKQIYSRDRTKLAVASFVSFLMELPAAFLSAWAAEQKSIGRRGIVLGCMAVGGAACLLSFLLKCINIMTWSVVWIANSARLFLGSSFLIVYLYSGELFPSSIRSTAVGCLSLAARVAGIVTPVMVASMEKLFHGLPLLIFGVVSLSSVYFASRVVPETLGKPMFDTVYQLRKFFAKTGFPRHLYLCPRIGRPRIPSHSSVELKSKTQKVQPPYAYIDTYTTQEPISNRARTSNAV